MSTPLPAPPQPAYAELHCLSNFSFQRGASHPEELVERAHQLGYAALAITDECSLAGIVRAHSAAKEYGLPLLVGSEFRLEDGLTLVLIAPDKLAYGNLCQLITEGRRSAAKGEYRLNRQTLARWSEGCLALWIPDEVPDEAAGRWVAAHFAGRAWLAVTLLRDGGDSQRLTHCLAMADALGLPPVAAGSILMHAHGRRALQDLLTAIRLGKPVAECGYALLSNGERHLRDPVELAALYPPALLAETLNVVARCSFSLDSLKYEYPEELVPPNHTPASYLAQEVERGLATRYPDGVPDKVRRLVDGELALIRELDYEAYFLTVYDVVTWARGQDILCQGRGSAANSSVCYALGITAVDPLESQTLFARFLSKERGEPPDIDVDFEHGRREEVIQYLYRKYGRDRAALAATVISYRTKSALRDVGRALGFEEAQLDRLSANLTWFDQRDALPVRLLEVGLNPTDRLVKLLIHMTQLLRGFPRHLSQHVGGFVLARGLLSRLVPIENASMPERTVIQWDKNDLDAVGLMKVDVLALGMLTAIRRALQLVSAIRGTPLAMHQIPREDPLVYDMICEADTIGVFQIESRAQMSMLPRLRPRKYYDLVIEVAIVRPGPIQGDMVHPYLRRRQGKEKPDPLDERLQPILERTFGVPIFQEQVMQIAVDGAGFSPGKADELRRAMAAWRRSGKLEVYRQDLENGLRTNGYSEDFIGRILKQIEGFSDYGFPESHAASFAKLVYASAWLKRHYPAAFACALLNSQPMGFYSSSQLIQDARRHGVSVLPVDVRVSQWDCTLEPPGQASAALRLGLRLVQGLSKETATRIEAVQAQGFDHVDTLRIRAGLDRRMLSALAKAGALEGLAGHRRAAWWQVSGIDAGTGLLKNASSELSTPALPAPTDAQDIITDYARLGLTLRAHPLTLLRERLTANHAYRAADLKGLPNKMPVWVAGLVVGRQHPGTAKGVTFFTLEDETGNVNVVVTLDLMERQRRVLIGSRMLAIQGELQHADNVIHVLAERAVDLSGWIGALDIRSRDFH